MKNFRDAILTLCVLVSLPIISTVGARPLQSDGARRITPADLRQLLKKGDAVVIDVRGEDAYKAGHVRGAKNIPFAQIADRVAELPPDKLIATYCS